MSVIVWKYILYHFKYLSRVFETSNYYSSNYIYNDINFHTTVPLVNRIRNWEKRKTKETRNRSH